MIKKTDFEKPLKNVNYKKQSESGAATRVEETVLSKLIVKISKFIWKQSGFVDFKRRNVSGTLGKAGKTVKSCWDFFGKKKVESTN